MKVKKSSFIIIFILLILVAFAMFFVDNREPMLWVTVSILFINCTIAWNDMTNRYTYMIFNLCFFTFLLGKVFFTALSNEKALADFSEYTIHKMYVYLSVSLICITLGMYICERTKVKIGRDKRYTQFVSIEENEEYPISPTQIKIITIAYYVTLPFYLMSILEKAVYVNRTSYLDYYTTFSSNIPYILIKIGELNLILFALLFCVQYEKRKLILPTLLFGIVSVLSLGMGQRNIFVLNMIMLVCCLYYANERSMQNLGERLYSKRTVLLSGAFIPIVISLLYALGNYRQEFSSSNTGRGFLEGIKQFFILQGGQIEFFANTIEYKQEIWAQKMPYTFASIYNYIRNLFGLTNFGTYTRDNALYGNSLGATQFYITSPSSLESGKGAGCCFLSELYFDAGVLGIIIGSLFLGYMLRCLRLDGTKKPWVNAFVILMIRWIVYIPRASYFDWISNPFNIWNVAIVIVVFGFANIISRPVNDF